MLWANGGGETHGFDEYAAWLQAAGLTQVAKLSERWLCAIRVGGEAGNGKLGHGGCS
jgi:hypothetical protein